MGALPDTVGLPAHDFDSPRGNVYLPVVGARRGHSAAALSAVQRAAVSEHDHQRAAGERGETGRTVLSCTVPADSPTGVKSIHILYLGKSTDTCTKNTQIKSIDPTPLLK